jgi:sulfur carrier protein ThiS
MSIEINGEIPGKTEFETTLFNDNDKVKFLYFIGGGCGTD